MIAPLSLVDIVVLVWVLLWGALGLRRGLTEQLISFGGLAVGAIIGARATPPLLELAGAEEWIPLATLAAGIVGALIAQAIAIRIAAPVRRVARFGPARPFDAGGGFVLGGIVGLAFAWLIASAAVFTQGDKAASPFREQVQRSVILSRALAAVPPDRLMSAISQLDPRPIIALAPTALPPPDESVLREPGAAAARNRVVQIRGRACGVPLQGSGWVAGRDLVATNAHVVAGVDDPDVLTPDGRRLEGTIVHMDRRDDIALLRVDHPGGRPLKMVRNRSPTTPVVLLGYPGGGSLTAKPGTAGPPRAVLAPGVGGNGRHLRTIVTVRGSLGSGSSGGPIVDRSGAVVAMIFGGTPGEDSTAAVPRDEIADALGSRLTPVGGGACA